MATGGCLAHKKKQQQRSTAAKSSNALYIYAVVCERDTTLNASVSHSQAGMWYEESLMAWFVVAVAMGTNVPFISTAAAVSLPARR